MPAALRYPLVVSALAIDVCVAFAIAGIVALPADNALDQLSALTVVVVGVAGWTLRVWYRSARRMPAGTTATVRRVRQQHRLTSRSWLEIDGKTWLPVFFDPALVTLPSPVTAEVGTTTVSWNGHAFIVSGRALSAEPPGRLIDNPLAPDAGAAERGAVAARPLRRLLLDAQSAVVGPFVGLFWVYLDGGGIPAFVGATCVGAAVAIWASAIRGSDPS